MRATRVLVALFVGACGGEQALGPPPPAVTTSLVVISGGTLTDTIGAAPTILVELRGSDGATRSSFPIHFSILNWSAFTPSVSGGISAGSGDSAMVAHTGFDSRVSALVTLYMRAGHFLLVVSADGVVPDTIPITVLPGAPAAVAVAHDTAMAFGAANGPQFVARDRGGNARSDAVALSVASGPCAMVGARVVAAGYGTCVVAGALGAYGDTTRLVIVPPFPMAGILHGPQLQYASFNSDLSQLSVARVLSVGKDVSPARGKGDMRIVYDPDSRGASGHLTVVDSSGATHGFDVSASGTTQESCGRFSPDGRWIYYSARGAADGFAVWRARPDGTEAERLSPAHNNRDLECNRVDVSPDGTTIYYRNDSAVLTAMDVSSRRERTFGMRVHTVRVSPDGRQLAYTALSPTDLVSLLYVVGVDGSQKRLISPVAYVDDSEEAPDWSPDGAWIAMRLLVPGASPNLYVGGFPALVRAQDGLILRLPPFATFGIDQGPILGTQGLVSGISFIH